MYFTVLLFSDEGQAFCIVCCQCISSISILYIWNIVNIARCTVARQQVAEGGTMWRKQEVLSQSDDLDVEEMNP